MPAKKGHCPALLDGVVGSRVVLFPDLESGTGCSRDCPVFAHAPRTLAAGAAAAAGSPGAALGDVSDPLPLKGQPPELFAGAASPASAPAARLGHKCRKGQLIRAVGKLKVYPTLMITR
jgi:hypothetical protein